VAADRVAGEQRVHAALHDRRVLRRCRDARRPGHVEVDEDEDVGLGQHRVQREPDVERVVTAHVHVPRAVLEHPDAESLAQLPSSGTVARSAPVAAVTITGRRAPANSSASASIASGAGCGTVGSAGPVSCTEKPSTPRARTSRGSDR